MPAPEAQPILSHPTEAAIFLVLTVSPGAEADVTALLADVAAVKRSVGFRVPEAELSCVVGIGAALWDRIGARPRPAELHPFRAFTGPRHTAPATPGDLLFHIRAHRFDLCFELAQRLMERLRGFASVVDEIHGFRSFDDRDVLGFVDGTENPEGAAGTSSLPAATKRRRHRRPRRRKSLTTNHRGSAACTHGRASTAGLSSRLARPARRSLRARRSRRPPWSRADGAGH